MPKKAAAYYGVDIRSILAEVGRRKMVGGLEDMIIDIALDLAGQGPDLTASRPSRIASRIASAICRLIVSTFHRITEIGNCFLRIVTGPTVPHVPAVLKEGLVAYVEFDGRQP